MEITPSSAGLYRSNGSTAAEMPALERGIKEPRSSGDWQDHADALRRLYGKRRKGQRAAEGRDDWRFV
jgi:hypothetical protein